MVLFYGLNTVITNPRERIQVNHRFLARRQDGIVVYWSQLFHDFMTGFSLSGTLMPEKDCSVNGDIFVSLLPIMGVLIKGPMGQHSLQWRSPVVPQEPAYRLPDQPASPSHWNMASSLDSAHNVSVGDFTLVTTINFDQVEL
ncbi:hypothetical protein HYFRA_00007207 [Hymenoscyphus fraxineus]|uniref:Uncharacterized protein n=1 Tax=Hymenoscyphus fraxineus TaxID=746836 RepID=A0A9N9PPZ1_9HELO|nr:hypothetical protein HYFRA_00007207 [Hymenoscyphus fraxineus]